MGLGRKGFFGLVEGLYGGKGRKVLGRGCGGVLIFEDSLFLGDVLL